MGFAAEAAYIEPVIVPDVFINGMLPVEDLGDGNVRFSFYVRQGGENVVVARLVVSREVAAINSQISLAQLGYRCCGAIKRMVDAIVHH